MKLHEYPDREMLFLGLADQMASDLADGLRRRDRAALAVPGGTSPGPVFDTLRGVALDWDRVDVVLTDERWVPEDDPRSNTRLLREHLLQDKAAAAHLVPLHADTPTPEEAIPGLEGAVRAMMPLDCLLLGMGEDMHTASLFPGGDKLDLALSPTAPALVAMRAPGVEEPRVTLTLPVLKSAFASHLLILGDAKRAALERAQGMLPEEAPIAALLGDLTVHWAP
ncbi:MAG TPA: 6-phosphogluconolactonase [Aliiroseovarius sp.]|nr:6-phosphogluconolactonase [Aliiroseovarius sp.]